MPIVLRESIGEQFMPLVGQRDVEDVASKSVIWVHRHFNQALEIGNKRDLKSPL
jgi:hypothetical protein